MHNRTVLQKLPLGQAPSSPHAMKDSTPNMHKLQTPNSKLQAPNIASVGLSVALCLLATRMQASIGTSLQMQLGNPSGAIVDTNNHNHYLIQRTVEALDFSDNLGEPNWASWDLTASDIGSSGRSPSFYTDTTLPGNFYHVTTSDYTGSGYDRGHMCPSDDRTDN